MLAASIGIGAIWPQGTDGLVLLAGALVVALILLAAALFVSLRLVSRRRWSAEVREVVVAIEELRGGKTRHRVELEPHSPLTLVADAVNRLAQEMHLRLGESASTAERLRHLMDAFGSSAIVTTDLDGDVRSFSGGAEALLGWTESEARSRPSSMLFDDDAYKEFLPRLSRRAERERGFETRTTLKRKDGGTLHANVTVRSLHGAQHEPVGLLFVVHDVSAQARLEEELRRSEERYRKLVEELSDGVAIVREGRLIYVNPTFATLCGRVPERLAGTLLRDRILTRDVLMVEERLAALEREPGRADEMACTLLGGEDRTRVDVRLHAVTVPYEGGPAILVLVRDETTRRRVEQELRRNESQLDAVLEATSDGILVLIDGPGGPLAQMTNRAFLRMFALREQDVLGVPQARLVAALRGRGDGAVEIAALLAARAPGSRGEQVRLGGGSPRELQASLTPLADREGRPIGRLLVCRDLTRQRESERALQEHAEQLQLSKVMLERAYAELDRANRDLRERGEELDRLNQELRHLDGLRTQLLGNVAHELHSPLVAIRGYTEMTLKERLGPVTAEQRKGLTLSLKNIDRLISMIDGMAAPSEGQPIVLERFPLRTLIEEVAGLLRSKMEARALHFELEMPDAELHVAADRDRIQQVLINLLSNAIKFNREGGSIEVRARTTGADRVTVEVEDTGTGIPPEAIERVFDRHFRAAGSESEGKGLGLSIVREILRRHGCDIRAASEPGRWTRLTFELPLAVTAAEATVREPDAPRADDAPPTGEPPPGGPPPGEPPAGGEPPRPRFRVIRRYGRR